MDVIYFLFIGIFVAVVAQQLTHEGPLGAAVTLGLGIVGAFAGGFVAGACGLASGLPLFAVSAVGAVLLLAGYHQLTARRASTG
jgi:uncharacterized membrane protein YeaQ/YmgE (transglycosylase-associated protein family)